MENQKPAAPAEKKKQEAVKNLYTTVVKEVNAGKSPDEIAAKLAGLGMAPEEAPKFVEAAMAKLRQKAEQEKPVAGSLALAILGGVLAAVLCGIGWGWLAKTTDKEYGYAAIAVGLLCGWAILLFTRGKKSRQLQITAAVCSLIGIFLGKYTSFFFQIKDYIIQKYGAQAADISPVSGKVFGVFLQNVNTMVGGYDILWVLLAVWSAWGILTPTLKR